MSLESKTPRVTVDGIIAEGGRVLFVRRKNPPFEGSWALPGGFVDYGETTEAATVRELAEETGLEVKVKRLLGVYSDPQRDPRGHTIGVVYICERAGGTLAAADDAADAEFHPLDGLPELAFDHALILKDFKALKLGN